MERLFQLPGVRICHARSFTECSLGCCMQPSQSTHLRNVHMRTVQRPPRCWGATRPRRAFHERVVRNVLLLVLLLVVSGCSMMLAPESGDRNVEFTTERQAYAPGDDVAITLTNRTKHGIGYNLCWSIVQQRVNGEWKAPKNVPGRICTAELRYLAQGRTASSVFPLPEMLPAGEYRIITSVENMRTGNQLAVATNPFAIGR